MTVESEQQAPSYQTQPSYAQKFKEPEVKDIVQSELKRKLTGAHYHPDNTGSATICTLLKLLLHGVSA